MGKKNAVDASSEEPNPTEVRVIGHNVLLSTSLLELLKTANLTQQK